MDIVGAEYNWLGQYRDISENSHEKRSTLIGSELYNSSELPFLGLGRISLMVAPRKRVSAQLRRLTTVIFLSKFDPKYRMQAGVNLFVEERFCDGEAQRIMILILSN
jgi:hypothetical protein